MKIPFFSKSEGVEKTFFGVFLKEQEGRGLVMKMKNSTLSLLEDEKFSYSNGWENLTEDIDHLILKFEERTKLHLSETIFFVYSHFIDPQTKEIHKTYFQKIKEVVKKLELKALGYIECYEAVVHYLSKKEESLLTAVILELDRTNLSVIVYKRGELVYSKVLTHTNNLIDDLLTCFQEVKGKFLLPSRIILYNTKDLDEEATEIVTHRWSEDLFIQLPRVEIIKEHEITQGMVEVFGQQFNKGTKGQLAQIENQEKPKQEVMGFVIGEDVQKETQEIQLQVPDDHVMKKNKYPDVLNTVGSQFKKLAKVMPKAALHFKKKWTIPLGIALVFVGIFLNEYFLHKAVLTIFLPFTTLEKTINMDVAIGQGSGDKFIIETTTQTVNLTDSIAATGKKEIGEKAKGVVTLHNFDDSEKAFAKGTQLENGSVKFSLDQDVKVASSSVVTISGGLVKQPGKTKANVTSDKIGPEGNLSSGKQFTIVGSPSSLYFGMNESAFSGGTKKEITTVSKKNLEDLESRLVEKAKIQKLNKIEGGSDEKLLNDLTEFDLSNLEFDKEVGEEAELVSLKAKVRTTLYRYQNNNLIAHLLTVLKDDVPNGFVMEKDKITYEIKKAKVNKGTIDLDISVKANAIRDVSKKDVLVKVKGKSKDGLENILKDSFKASGFTIDIQPNIPLINNVVPFFEKNISIKISTL